MKAHLFLAIVSLTALTSQARAALGEDSEKCNDRYGEQTTVRDDSMNAQCTERWYPRPRRPHDHRRLRPA